MRFKNLFLTLVLALAVLSCKDEDKKVQETEVLPDAFRVTLDVVIKKNDDFCLLYTQDKSINFKDGVWQGVKGSANSQKVVFTLPEGVKPTELRIDLGRNPEQEDIILNSVTMDYIGKSRTIGCPELVAFFRADDSKCSFDHVTGLIKAVVKDGVRQNPSLYPHEKNLMPEIQKILN